MDSNTIFQDKYWITRGNRKIITYIGSPLVCSPPEDELRKYLRVRHAMVAMWNYDEDYALTGPWYRCICDTKGYSETSIQSSNVRHNLRRSLHRCSIQELDFRWLADHGYKVYRKGAANFFGYELMELTKYKQDVLANLKYDNRKAYGAFVDSQLVAYITLIMCVDSVFGDTAFFDPDYSNAYPMYGLYYTIAHDVLSSGYKAFDRGTRPLVHETNIDSFLLRLGFRLSYCKLGLYVTPSFRLALSSLTIASSAFPKMMDSHFGKSIFAYRNACKIAADQKGRKDDLAFDRIWNM